MLFIVRFHGHSMLLISVVLIGLLCLPGYASASFPEFALEEVRADVTAASETYNTIRAELELADPSTWSVTQTHNYLNAALWVIYDGLKYYNMQNGCLPDSLEQLGGTTYIPEWPANLYNEWKPIRILNLTDGFSPGDVVWQICPPEFYSCIKNTRPISCELGIYGPDIEYANLGDAQPLKSNTWAVTPEGAVFMLGQFAEKASVSLEHYKELFKDK
jgi:hypothetical protein